MTFTVLLVAGCAAPPPKASLADERLLGLDPAIHDNFVSPAGGLQRMRPHRVFGDPFAPDAPPAGPPAPSPTDDVLEPLLGGHVNRQLGEALQARLDEFSEDEVDYYGVARLTLEELLGTEANDFEDALCEDSEVLLEFDEGGVRYEASYQVPYYYDLIGDIIPATNTLNTTCADALEADPDVEAALASEACFLDDEAEFFPDGSECRACLDGGLTWPECVGSGVCLEEAQMQVWWDTDAGPVFYEVLLGTLWTCAPDWTSLVLFAVHLDDDGSIPRAWDHAGWGYMCMPFWVEELGDIDWFCHDGTDGPDLGDTLGAGANGYVRYIRPEGSDDAPWFDRGYYARYMEVGQGEVRHFWAWNPGIGAVSMDVVLTDSNGDGVIGVGDDAFGHEKGYAWGTNPNDTRPDGESKVRDFIALETMKSSTKHNGVFSTAANHSRCEDDAWTGPHADGSYRCEALGPPVEGWLNDAQVGWLDTAYEQVYAYPLMTLASTGLPDAGVPGGHVIHLAGSPGLALEDYEGCTYPDTFAPDIVRMPDVSGEWSAGSLDGQVYRFGKDDLDLRMTFSASAWRDYCPMDGG